MLDKIIYYSFGLLFFLTPLIWTPLNFELFEFNKMLFVYFLTTLIIGSWILKSINQKNIILNKTPLDIPLLLFLSANILSTIFSIDPHTSIWGYYSRQNGGLLSIISYSLLYWALVSNISRDQIFRLLKLGLVSGFIISLWGIFEHFGVSPSCVILRGEFNASCWVQDVAARVFATLGQPNWLAGYLAMLIFPALYFFMTAATKKISITYFISLIAMYLAFTFTYSRGATLGLLAGLGVFATLLLFKRSRRILPILGLFLVINLLFGSAFTRFNLSNLFPKSSQPSLTFQQTAATTQLETGGTESGQIRLIVWQGALDIFKNYPIFGSGVETFAYSYYQFRPAVHNLVSEWDFLYNKAHNEYLNYLSTTGIVGFGSYSIIIITFIIVILKKLRTNPLLLPAILASYISYLISNFFGFSVVITALFFFLFPAMACVATDCVQPFKLPRLITSIIYRRKIYTKAIQLFILLSTFYLLVSIIRLWIADTRFSKGMSAEDSGNVGRAYNFLSDAISLRPSEPFYRSELGFVAAASSLTLRGSDATASGQLKDTALSETEKALTTSPKNVSFWRTAVRTYFELSNIDPSFLQKTQDSLDQAIKLAPTDPKLLYNKAVILGQNEKPEASIKILQEAIRLKPNYREAYLALSLFYFDEGQKLEAVESMRKVLEIVPGDSEALEHLNDWGEQGIATGSGKP